jgi:hypothetical protein
MAEDKNVTELGWQKVVGSKPGRFGGGVIAYRLPGYGSQVSYQTETGGEGSGIGLN